VNESQERSTALTTIPGGAPGILRPQVTVEQAVQAWNEYMRLCQALLTDEDYQTIGAKHFKKKSAWRKLGNVFSLSVVVLDKQIVRADPQDPASEVVYAEFAVQATAPSGRTMAGWGACSVHEDRAFTKPDHDIPATAMTRAVNRATSDLIGAGEVSAEEVEGSAEAALERSAARQVAGGALATPAQVKAMYAIARQNRSLNEEELEEIVRTLYSGRQPSQLGKREASELIDKLKGDAPLLPHAKAPSRPAEPAPAPAGSPRADDEWTVFYKTARGLGYKSAAEIWKALGVAGAQDWLAKGKTQAEAITELADLAGKPRPEGSTL